jgi:hypothetical protein
MLQLPRRSCTKMQIVESTAQGAHTKRLNHRCRLRLTERYKSNAGVEGACMSPMHAHIAGGSRLQLQQPWLCSARDNCTPAASLAICRPLRPEMLPATAARCPITCRPDILTPNHHTHPGNGVSLPG